MPYLSFTLDTVTYNFNKLTNSKIALDGSSAVGSSETHAFSPGKEVSRGDAKVFTATGTSVKTFENPTTGIWAPVRVLCTIEVPIGAYDLTDSDIDALLARQSQIVTAERINVLRLGGDPFP